MNVSSIVGIAALIGERGRIQMLAALLDGRSHSASDLAMVASLSPQTASAHLTKLCAGGLIDVTRQGRQRLFRLKSADVAAAIEALGSLAPNPQAPAMTEIRFARTCYDHLGGVLAIAVRDELLRRGALRLEEKAFTLTPAGARLLGKLDIDIDWLRGLRRAFACKCLDWTERHHHIGGALGAGLLSHFLELKWLVRIRDTRAVRLSHAGERGLEQVLHIRCAELRVNRAAV